MSKKIEAPKHSLFRRMYKAELMKQKAEDMKTWNRPEPKIPKASPEEMRGRYELSQKKKRNAEMARRGY